MTIHDSLAPRLPVGEADAALPRLAQTYGMEFLQELVAWIQARCDVDLALVGQLELGPDDRMRVMAIKSRSPQIAFESYPFANSTCERVIRQEGVLFLERDVCKHFPDSDFLRQSGIESYAGVPLMDSAGVPIGVLCVAGFQPMADGGSILETLSAYAPRAAAVLENRERFATLAAILEATAESGTPESFRRIVCVAAASLRARLCFIGEAIADDPEHFRMVAFSHLGETDLEIEGRICRYAETPCGGLQMQDRLVFRSDLRSRFPNDRTLADYAAESFLGVVLRDAEGQRLGHLAILHDRQIGSRVERAALLDVLSGLAAEELARKRSIDERRKAERAMLAAQKIESLGLMAGSIAHDFNNLLVGILGNAELAGELLAAGSKAGRLVGEIEQRALQARDMISQLLDYAGRDLEPDHRSFDLRSAVEDGQHLLPLGKYPDADLTIETGGEPLTILGDPVQLARVVMNLAVNALEALPGGRGRVAIRTRRCRLDARERAAFLFGGDSLPEDCVVLEVADEGSGIDSADIGRVLDPFFSTKAAGRGLGLSAVQGTVRSHRGALAIESAPGGGTSIRLYLERQAEAAAAAAAEPEPAERPAPSGSKEVLLADDQEDVRQVIARQLASLGYNVTAVASGREALDALSTAARPFGSVLLDVAMPDLDGWEVLAQLRESHPALPVLMLSGYTDRATSERSRVSRQVGFLAKPFRRQQLAEALEELLAES